MAEGGLLVGNIPVTVSVADVLEAAKTTLETYLPDVLDEYATEFEVAMPEPTGVYLSEQQIDFDTPAIMLFDTDSLFEYPSATASTDVTYTIAAQIAFAEGLFPSTATPPADATESSFSQAIRRYCQAVSWTMMQYLPNPSAAGIAASVWAVEQRSSTGIETLTRGDTGRTYQVVQIEWTVYQRLRGKQPLTP